MPKPRADDSAPSMVGYGWALLITAAATAVGWPMHHGFHMPVAGQAPHISNINVLMIYLLGVLWTATRYNRGAAVFCSLLSVAAFDFCFVPPYFTFNVSESQYILTFAVMLVTALTISTLTHRVRVQSEKTREAWERVETEFLRNTLLSGVSHELRTPLASITGAATAMAEAKRDLSEDARAELLDTVITEAERMERLINNLLDMTRLEAGGIALKRDWQPLDETIGAALRNIDRRRNGRQIKTSIPHNLPLLHIDTASIEQVIVNLLDNALEYTPADSAIQISARADANEVLVEVADQGPGLAPGTESRVFEKFFRAARTSGHRGIGLGLAICRGIVEIHGGRISAANRPEGGALFTFTLPIPQQPPTIDEPA